MKLSEERTLKLLKGNAIKEAIDDIIENSDGDIDHDSTLSDGDKVNLISASIVRSFREAKLFSLKSPTGKPIVNSELYHISYKLSAEAILDAILKYQYPTDKGLLRKIVIVACDQPTHTYFANRMTELKHGTNRTAPMSLSTSLGVDPGDATSVTPEAVDLVSTGASTPTPPETTGMYLNIY